MARQVSHRGHSSSQILSIARSRGPTDPRSERSREPREDIVSPCETRHRESAILRKLTNGHTEPFGGMFSSSDNSTRRWSEDGVKKAYNQAPTLDRHIRA